MAYVPGSEGSKKGLKLVLNVDDTPSTRSYSGLNYADNGDNSASLGASTSNAIMFFASAIQQLTDASLTQQYATTEKPYIYQS